MAQVAPQTSSRLMFHTQERRSNRLTAPLKCTNPSAWLGHGYYFWYDEQDAFNWGIQSKKATGYFEIYQCDVDCTDVLDTVFNEAHYNFWVGTIEKIAKTFVKKKGVKPPLRYINDYCRDRGIWNSVAGILFQDLPTNDEYVMVIGLYYKKRIQLVAFDLKIASGFKMRSSEKCT